MLSDKLLDLEHPEMYFELECLWNFWTANLIFPLGTV